MSLSEKLKELRENQRWTQSYLADVLKVDRSTISRYETGKSIPTYQTVIQFADVYNIEKDFLVNELDSLLPLSEQQPYILKESPDDLELGLIIQLIQKESDLKSALLEINLLEGNRRAFFLEKLKIDLKVLKKYKRI